MTSPTFYPAQPASGRPTTAYPGLRPTASQLPMRLQQPTAPQSQPQANKKEPNIWRDTLLRYIGYADEFGEALEPFIGKKAVTLTYVISSIYGALDGVTTSFKAWRNPQNATTGDKTKATAAQIGDAVLFHVPATVFIPAFFVGRIREIANYLASKGKNQLDHHGQPQQWSGLVKLMRKPLDAVASRLHANPALSAKLTRRAPIIAAALGIASIPVVGHPVDKAINRLLDATYRKWTGINAPPTPVEFFPERTPEEIKNPHARFSLNAPDTFEALFR